MGTARGAHLLKVIALLVHIIPLCPLQRGETRSWWICREGLVCVGCCRLVLFPSPFFHAPWTHFPGGSEVSEGIGEGESTSRQNPIYAYRHFSLFLFQSTLFQSRYNSSIHISLCAGQNISSRAPEPERGSLSLQSPRCLHVRGMGRKVRVKAAPSSPLLAF